MNYFHSRYGSEMGTDDFNSFTQWFICYFVTPATLSARSPLSPISDQQRYCSNVQDQWHGWIILEALLFKLTKCLTSWFAKTRDNLWSSHAEDDLNWLMTEVDRWPKSIDGLSQLMTQVNWWLKSIDGSRQLMAQDNW